MALEHPTPHTRDNTPCRCAFFICITYERGGLARFADPDDAWMLGALDVIFKHATTGSRSAADADGYNVLRQKAGATLGALEDAAFQCGVEQRALDLGDGRAPSVAELRERLEAHGAETGWSSTSGQTEQVTLLRRLLQFEAVLAAKSAPGLVLGEDSDGDDVAAVEDPEENTDPAATLEEEVVAEAPVKQLADSDAEGEVRPIRLGGVHCQD